MELSLKYFLLILFYNVQQTTPFQSFEIKKPYDKEPYHYFGNYIADSISSQNDELDTFDYGQQSGQIEIDEDYFNDEPYRPNYQPYQHSHMYQYEQYKHNEEQDRNSWNSNTEPKSNLDDKNDIHKYLQDMEPHHWNGGDLKRYNKGEEKHYIGSETFNNELNSQVELGMTHLADMTSESVYFLNVEPYHSDDRVHNYLDRRKREIDEATEVYDNEPYM